MHKVPIAFAFDNNTIPVAPACLISHNDTGSFGPYQRHVCSHKIISNKKIEN